VTFGDTFLKFPAVMYEVVKTAPMQQRFKMESVNGVRYKKRVVGEFFVAEKVSVGNTHKRLCSVYGSTTVDRSTAGRWAKSVTASETGKSELHDLPRSGRPVTDVSPETLQRADDVICEDRRITT
jgi:hypothetical protein